MISQDIKMGLLHKLIAHPEIDTTALSVFSFQAFIQNHPLHQQHMISGTSTLLVNIVLQ